MATDKSFVDYVLDSLAELGDVRVKKMFGDYCLYYRSVPVLLLCDNTVFIKKIAETEEILENCEEGYPYDGAKLHYILDVDDVEMAKSAVIKFYERKTKERK